MAARKRWTAEEFYRERIVIGGWETRPYAAWLVSILWAERWRVGFPHEVAPDARRLLIDCDKRVRGIVEYDKGGPGCERFRADPATFAELVALSKIVDPLEKLSRI